MGMDLLDALSNKSLAASPLGFGRIIDVLAGVEDEASGIFMTVARDIEGSKIIPDSSKGRIVEASS